MLKLGVSLLSVACAVGIGTGCGNVKYPKPKAKPAVVTETPQGQTSTQTPGAKPAPVPGTSSELKSLATSLSSIHFVVSHAGTQASLSFSHLSADKISSDGLPSVINIENLHGEIDGRDQSVTLQDPAVPGYSAKAVCTESAASCQNWVIDLTLKSGKQAGTAKIRAQAAQGLTLGVAVQGELKEEVEKTFDAQSKSAFAKESGVLLYRVEGGKTFFNSRTEIKPTGIAEQSPDHFEKRVLMVSGTVGKAVIVQLGDLLQLKTGAPAMKSLSLEADVDFSATPFSLNIKPRKSGLFGLELFVSPVAEDTSGSAGTQAATL